MRWSVGRPARTVRDDQTRPRGCASRGEQERDRTVRRDLRTGRRSTWPTLVAAEAAGKVRTGLNPDDVILALAGLWQLNPAGDWQTQAQQLYQLVFAGLRPD